MISDEKRAYNRAYYLANRERLIAAQKVRWEQGKDAIKAQRRARRQSDPATLRQQERESYQRNREAILERQRVQRASGYHRFKEHGLSRDEYDAMYAVQDGRCAICRGEFGRIPYIDHDHTTGQVRGLLCFHCNTALGHFRDSPENLALAIEYLRAYAPAGLEAAA